MPGLSESNGEGYRYGFNGYEKDDEVKGFGNSYDFGERIHDPRLGRFLSLDPKMRDYPFMSPYCFAGNIPIYFIDVDGAGPGGLDAKAEEEKGSDNMKTGKGIAVAFPDAPARVPKWIPGEWDDTSLGHAGFIVVSENGGMEYFDFGRYTRPDLGKRPDNHGAVRSKENYGGLKLDPWDFNKTDDQNVVAALKQLKASGVFPEKYGRIIGTMGANLDAPAMLSRARQVEEEGYLYFGGHTTGYYTSEGSGEDCSNSTYCSKFARDLATQGGYDWKFTTYTGEQNVFDFQSQYKNPIFDSMNDYEPERFVPFTLDNPDYEDDMMFGKGE